MSTLDLTTAEQTNVRTALRFLRARCGTWANLGKAIRFKDLTLSNVANGRTVTPALAFRVARFAKVGVDELLAGKYPPVGTCPHCGPCEVT